MPRRFVPFAITCERCGIHVLARYPGQRFCSRSCAARGPRPNRRRRSIAPRDCQCGQSFVPSQPRIKFCSRECVRRFGGTLWDRVCPHCDDQFTTRSAIQTYCSVRCARNRRASLRVRPCQRCGTEFRGLDSRRRFCGKECAYASARERRGERAINWRGGRIVSRSYGYVWRRAEGHPRTKAKWPYVLEHILVMEETLGRYLMPFERVHHRNGVRHDNRPENLELWKVKDPAGVRADDYHCAGCRCGGVPTLLIGPQTTVTSVDVPTRVTTHCQDGETFTEATATA
jgi:HNH endonuclease